MSDSDAGLEAVHHACLAGDFDSAAALLYKYVYFGPNAVVTRQEGKHQAALESLEAFYPFRDPNNDPRVTSADARRWILHETAACYHQLGRLVEASALGMRAVSAALATDNLHAAATSLHNLAESYLAAGATGACEDAARQSLKLALDMEEHEDELVACTLLGTVLDLRADFDASEEMFGRALAIAGEYTSVPILYSLSGIRYASHMFFTGRTQEALNVARRNAEFCQGERWISELALARSQIASWELQDELNGIQLSESAVRTARTSGNHQVLGEVLLAHGRNMMTAGAYADARMWLEEARTIAVEAGYQVLVCLTRLALAEVRHASDDDDGAQAELGIAVRLALDLELKLLWPDLERVRQSIGGVVKSPVDSEFPDVELGW